MSELSLAYILIYVPDVARATDFWRRAFGLELGFMHESGEYAEMSTGVTTLGFLSESMAASNMGEFRKNRSDDLPAGVEIAFSTKDVEAAWQRATAAGALPIKPPAQKPWGQTVAYVRDPEGPLVELCTPMK